MTQSRIHDYRSPRSSADLNRKLVGILPPGVYAGFTVHADGSIDPGVLLTPEGVRIEEDGPVSVSVPPGDATHPRLDMVVCIHEYLPTVPNVAAHFEVVEGTPASAPDYPDLPDHAVLLAKCRMNAGENAWSEVLNVGPPVGTAPELAGPDRTTETVHGNAEAIENLAGPGRTTETVKANADAIAQEASTRQSGDNNLQQQITNHLNDTSGPHAASSVPIQDSGNRYSGGNVEAALQEIAGAGRSNQTVKGNADAISNHIGNASGAHAASSISTQAVSGSPFSLSQAEVQAALAALVGGMNLRALKAGDTFSGAVTFQNDVIFDADDVDDVKFDEDIIFIRTVPAAAGRSDNCEFSNSHGVWHMQHYGDEVAIPIPGINKAKLHTVKFFFTNEAGNPDPTNVNCKVYRKSTFTSVPGADLVVQDSVGLLGSPTSNMAAGIELDTNDQEMVYHGGIVAFTYYAVARLSELDLLPNPCHFIGLRIEYKRQRLAV